MASMPKVAKQMFRAVRDQDPAKLAELIESAKKRGNTFLGYRDQEGSSLLHVAAALNDDESIKVILKNNPYLMSSQNNFGQVPLMVAIMENSWDAVEIIFQKGGYFDQPCTDGHRIKDVLLDKKRILEKYIEWAF